MGIFTIRIVLAVNTRPRWLCLTEKAALQLKRRFFNIWRLTKNKRPLLFFGDMEIVSQKLAAVACSGDSSFHNERRVRCRIPRSVIRFLNHEGIRLVENVKNLRRATSELFACFGLPWESEWLNAPRRRNSITNPLFQTDAKPRSD